MSDGYGPSPDKMANLNLQLRDATRAYTELLAMNQRLRVENTKLREALNAEHHVAVFDANGWALEHSINCRLAETMTTCEYNAAMERTFTEGEVEPGRLLSLIEKRRWRIIGIEGEIVVLGSADE